MTSIVRPLGIIAVLAAVAVLPGSCTRENSSALVHDCDRLAAGPYDPGRSPDVAGVPMDHLDASRAIPACRAALAADPDNPHLLYEMGRALYVARNYGSARNFMERAVAGGSTAAEMTLGWAYNVGFGTGRDYPRAYRLLEDAAVHGLAPAQATLADLYYFGHGVRQNRPEAIRWFRKAADQGYAEAETRLGLELMSGGAIKPDPAKALQWFHKAADQNQAPAEFQIGLAYLFGQGVKKDVLEALLWFRRASDQNYAPALTAIGLGYLSGQGVNQNVAEASYWLERAARRGDATAQVNLARLYANGMGSVPPDLVKARYFAAMASRQGSAEAAQILAVLSAGAPTDPNVIAKPLLEKLASGVIDSSAQQWCLNPANLRSGGDNQPIVLAENRSSDPFPLVFGEEEAVRWSPRDQLIMALLIGGKYIAVHSGGYPYSLRGPGTPGDVYTPKNLTEVGAIVENIAERGAMVDLTGKGRRFGVWDPAAGFCVTGHWAMDGIESWSPPAADAHGVIASRVHVRLAFVPVRLGRAAGAVDEIDPMQIVWHEPMTFKAARYSDGWHAAAERGHQPARAVSGAQGDGGGISFSGH